MGIPMKQSLLLLTWLILSHANAMDYPNMLPARTTAVVDSVENKSPYRITMSLSGITTVIDKGENLQNLNFEIPVHESHQINETYIYVNGETRARLSLAAILNQPQRLGKQTLREFVVKLTMLYPKFFKNEHWQWRNSYVSDFFENGDNHWLFKIKIVFKGNNLEETELFVVHESKYTR